MARKKNGRNGNIKSAASLPGHTKRAIICVLLIAVGVFLTLAAFGAAGIAGSSAYHLLQYLLGYGYFIVPLLFLLLGVAALREESSGFTPLKLASSALFLVAGLGFVDVVSGKGGLVGHAIGGPVSQLFDIYAGSILLGALSLIALLIVLEGRISLAT